MRQVIFILVLSSILVPASAFHQGLISPQSMSEEELVQSLNAAFTQVSEDCQRAENWLRSEF
jgi:hypothetical protein